MTAKVESRDRLRAGCLALALGAPLIEFLAPPVCFSANQAAGSRFSGTIIIASGVVFSTTTVSTTRPDGCISFRAGFFVVARLDLAVATARFFVVALAALRALGRLAELPLRSFAPFCTFDPFLRLAMIAPLGASMTDQKTTGEVRQPIQRGYQQIFLACGTTIKSPDAQRSRN